VADALIGYTGFVGGNLRRQHVFAAMYNSSNIETSAGQRFELVVCAGAPAAKWIANQEPEKDAATLQRLMDALDRVTAEHVVLISTVDVYPEPVAVYEDTPIRTQAHHAYGRHRFQLEQHLRSRFPTTILRLPGLFGAGLKKNVVYDFLHGNALEKIPSDGVFQFYSLAHLWSDVLRTRDAAIDLLNVATEPVSVRELAREAFGLTFHNDAVHHRPRYDMRSRHARLLAGREDYLYGRQQVLNEMRAFVEAEGWKRP
jgi:nucleoside-diphosphate-sugar epimerase